MPLLKLIDEVCAAEENFYEVDSDEPRDKLGDRRRERAFREMSHARDALWLYRQQVQLIGCICVQYNLPAGDPCWMAKHIAEFV